MEIVFLICNFILGFVTWRIHKDDQDHRLTESLRWQEYGKRITDLEHDNVATIHNKLAQDRKLADLNNLIKDNVVELHNLQDHLCRNDRDVIELNRTFSKLRPIVTVRLPEDKKQKLKPKARAN